MARSLNKVTLIGNLTRDPELKYTPSGAAVCTIGLATNRQWTTDSGEKKEDAEFHKLVAWNKLAELCSQLIGRGRRVYVEGRIQYREIVDVNNLRKQVSEIIIDDMIILDSKNLSSGGNYSNNGPMGQANLGQSDNVPESDMPVAGEMIEDVVIPDDLSVDIGE